MVDNKGMPPAAPCAAAERFRSELRERLMRMRTVAGQNAAKSHYLESLEQSSAAILRAIANDEKKPASAMK
jgi:ribosomal protein S12